MCAAPFTMTPTYFLLGGGEKGLFLLRLSLERSNDRLGRKFPFTQSFSLNESFFHQWYYQGDKWKYQNILPTLVGEQPSSIHHHHWPRQLKSNSGLPRCWYSSSAHFLKLMAQYERAFAAYCFGKKCVRGWFSQELVLLVLQERTGSLLLFFLVRSWKLGKFWV